MSKLTRQGVRDLDAGRPRKKKPDVVWAPPPGFQCMHPKDALRITHSGDTECRRCGQVWDWNGDPYG